MFDFTTETVLNDLSRVSVIDDSATIAAPGTVTPTGSTSGGTLAATTFYYKVTALTAKGETTGSPEANVTTTGAGTSSVGLAWTAITGAIGYNVYRGTATGAENVQYFTATNSFTDTGAAGVTDTVPSSNTAYVVSDQGVPGGDKALYIKKLNKYLKSNAGKVYRRVGTSPVNEVATITLPSSGNTGGVYRLNLDVIMSGSYPIDYDRWAINKGKPFYVEVLVATGTYTGSQLATLLLAGFIRGLKKYNGQNITDIVPTANGANIVITASNEYMRFKNSLIELEDAAGENWTTISTGTVTTHGVEGFGTAWFITKNMRIPTQEATRFFGLDQDERPINGVIYNQYTFQYTAARNFTGQSAVGAQLTSKTTHVLYIPQTLASTFETSVTSAFGAGSLLDAASGIALN